MEMYVQHVVSFCKKATENFCANVYPDVGFYINKILSPYFEGRYFLLDKHIPGCFFEDNVAVLFQFCNFCDKAVEFHYIKQHLFLIKRLSIRFKFSFLPVYSTNPFAFK